MNPTSPNCAAVPDAFPILNFGSMPESEFADLAIRFRQHRSIKLALDWFLQESSAFSPRDVIAQDEYSHDVLFPYHHGYWISYECT